MDFPRSPRIDRTLADHSLPKRGSSGRERERGRGPEGEPNQRGARDREPSDASRATSSAMRAMLDSVFRTTHGTSSTSSGAAWPRPPVARGVNPYAEPRPAAKPRAEVQARPFGRPTATAAPTQLELAFKGAPPGRPPAVSKPAGGQVVEAEWEALTPLPAREPAPEPVVVLRSVPPASIPPARPVPRDVRPRVRPAEPELVDAPPGIGILARRVLSSRLARMSENELEELLGDEPAPEVSLDASLHGHAAPAEAVVDPEPEDGFDWTFGYPSLRTLLILGAGAAALFLDHL